MLGAVVASGQLSPPGCGRAAASITVPCKPIAKGSGPVSAQDHACTQAADSRLHRVSMKTSEKDVHTSVMMIFPMRRKATRTRAAICATQEIVSYNMGLAVESTAIPVTTYSTPRCPTKNKKTLRNRFTSTPRRTATPSSAPSPLTRASSRRSTFRRTATTCRAQTERARCFSRTPPPAFKSRVSGYAFRDPFPCVRACVRGVVCLWVAPVSLERNGRYLVASRCGGGERHRVGNVDSTVWLGHERCVADRGEQRPRSGGYVH